jgi:glycosyltransferase involved in cell wall biosynthesis
MASRPRFSIVVPAHNEEALLGRGLAAIDRAVRRAGTSGEVVVVANRCTDRTEEIARAAGAAVVIDGHRNIAATRNAGVAASTGEIVVTIDADTVMHPDALVEIGELASDGRFVGGGSRFVLDRRSIGLALSRAAIQLGALASRTGGVVYWCARHDFDAIGGFDESKRVGEDVDFAVRLRRLGRATGRRFRNVRRSPSTVSVRKFDTYGDWHMFVEVGRMIRHPSRYVATTRGTDTTFADEYFYDFNS